MILNKVSPGQPASAAKFVPLNNSAVSNTIGMGVLCIFIFLLLGRVADFYFVGFRLPLVFSILALICAIVGGRFLEAMRSRTAIVMLLFTFWITLGVPFSVWRGGSVEVLNGWLKSFVSFLVITALVTTIDEGIQVLKTVAFAGLCVAVLSVFKAGSMDNRLILSEGLYTGPNELANAAVMGLIAWWFMVGQPNISIVWRCVHIGIAAFVGSLLPRTGSRGGLITIAVLLLVALFRLRPAMRFLMILGAIVTVGILSITLPADIRARYVGMFSKPESVNSEDEARQLANASGSSQERWRLLVSSLIVTARHPVFGVGLGNFGVARADMMTAEGKRGSYQGTHNTYTQISSETGLPAFILFMLSIGFCWKDIRRVERLVADARDPQSRKVRNAAYALRLLLLSYMVFFCFEHIGYDPFYLVFCGLITAFSQAVFRSYANRPATVPVIGPANPKAMSFVRQPVPAEAPRYRFGGRIAPSRKP